MPAGAFRVDGEGFDRQVGLRPDRHGRGVFEQQLHLSLGIGADALAGEYRVANRQPATGRAGEPRRRILIDGGGGSYLSPTRCPGNANEACVTRATGDRLAGACTRSSRAISS